MLKYKEDYLKQAPLFATLDDRFLEDLADFSQMKSFAAEQTIVRQGAQEGWELGLYVVAHGSVRITRTDDDGTERKLAILHSGDCFGEMSVLDGEPRSATAVAQEPTECVFLSAIDFRDALARQPKIALNLLRLLTRRLREADQAPLD